MEGETETIETETDIKTETSTEVNQDGTVNQEDNKADETPQKQFYSAEELKSLNPDELDTSRIPPETMPFYKSFQSGYTKKYQEVAEERKRLEEERRTVNEPAKPKTIYDIFDEKPEEVMSDVSQTIAQLRYKDPFNPDLIKLETLRDNLQIRATKQFRDKIKVEEENKKTETENNKVYLSLRESITDFDKKVPFLIDFAIKNYGFNVNEISKQVSAQTVGVANAVKFMKMLNRLYDMDNAGKSAEGKINSKTFIPNKAGSGSVGKQKSLKLEAAYKNAIKKGTTDAWAEYIALTEQPEGKGG